MKILITGFAPFGGEAVNPSWEAVSRLPEQFQTSKGEAAVLSKHQMPVSYNRCGQIIEDFIRRELPDCVVCVGQAGGRAGIEVEQIAINLKDAQSPDNEGTVFSGEPVTQGGPDGRFARLPVRDMVKACREAGVFLCRGLCVQLPHVPCAGAYREAVSGHERRVYPCAL